MSNGSNNTNKQSHKIIKLNKLENRQGFQSRPKISRTPEATSPVLSHKELRVWSPNQHLISNQTDNDEDDYDEFEDEHNDNFKTESEFIKHNYNDENEFEIKTNSKNNPFKSFNNVHSPDSTVSSTNDLKSAKK